MVELWVTSLQELDYYKYDGRALDYIYEDRALKPWITVHDGRARAISIKIELSGFINEYRALELWIVVFMMVELWVESINIELWVNFIKGQSSCCIKPESHEMHFADDQLIPLTIAFCSQNLQYLQGICMKFLGYNLSALDKANRLYPVTQISALELDYYKYDGRALDYIYEDRALKPWITVHDGRARAISIKIELSGFINEYRALELWVNFIKVELWSRALKYIYEDRALDHFYDERALCYAMKIELWVISIKIELWSIFYNERAICYSYEDRALGRAWIIVYDSRAPGYIYECRALGQFIKSCVYSHEDKALGYIYKDRALNHIYDDRAPDRALDHFYDERAVCYSHEDKALGRALDRCFYDSRALGYIYKCRALGQFIKIELWSIFYNERALCYSYEDRALGCINEYRALDHIYDDRAPDRALDHFYDERAVCYSHEDKALGYIYKDRALDHIYDDRALELCVIVHEDRALGYINKDRALGCINEYRALDHIYDDRALGR
ncbi:hypothetical protein Glove_24g44 [Diversispora epigaea]|uniref:Uncharacterized protein n=1 Tax=Diversispora epigaea TaxID=1348612 RepID=A0A397JLQ9_9GLOM|nr:hypothetical protein Glove_24g44 [Diversispora epigaea]